jgi:hypothetical protein
MLEPEIAALDDGAVDHLGVFVEPSLVLLRTSRIDHDIARAADPLFGAEAELHLALDHPNESRKQLESEQRFELMACILIFGWIPIVLGWMLVVWIFG